MIGCVYKLVCPKSDKDIYIGSTIHSLSERLSGHMSCSITGTAPVNIYIRENKIIPDIVLLEEVIFKDVHELRVVETKWIVLYKEKGLFLLNKRKALIQRNRKNLLADILIKNIPPDVMNIIRIEQSTHKKSMQVKQFSLSKTVIKIIREWSARCRESTP